MWKLSRATPRDTICADVAQEVHEVGIAIAVPVIVTPKYNRTPVLALEGCTGILRLQGGLDDVRLDDDDRERDSALTDNGKLSHSTSFLKKARTSVDLATPKAYYIFRDHDANGWSEPVVTNNNISGRRRLKPSASARFAC